MYLSEGGKHRYVFSSSGWAWLGWPREQQFEQFCFPSRGRKRNAPALKLSYQLGYSPVPQGWDATLLWTPNWSSRDKGRFVAFRYMRHVRSVEKNREVSDRQTVSAPTTPPRD